MLISVADIIVRRNVARLDLGGIVMQSHLEGFEQINFGSERGTKFHDKNRNAPNVRCDRLRILHALANPTRTGKSFEGLII